jgi:thiamine-monophosphate kinase
MKKIDDRKTLREVGERFIVREITGSLCPSELLLDGFGHDAAFVDISVANEEILVINTDRSGLNIAYQLGLAGAECVGDLGVSHAISDVVAAGGCPRTVTVALLLPPDTEVSFVRELMKGVERAAIRYGAIITGGDTKKNPKFAMVVTAIGTAHKDKRLRRSTARQGDALVVTGHLGSMLLGTVAFKNNLDVSSKIRCILEDALVNQNPPFELGRAFADAGIANACMDISDGLSGTLFSICTASGVGAVIDESKLPINPELLDLAKSIGLRPMQLTLAGGDWQYLYSISTDKLEEAKKIASNIGFPITVIGNTVEPNIIAARTSEGTYRHLKRIEHDSFLDKSSGKGYFENLGNPLPCFGDVIDAQIIEEALKV